MTPKALFILILLAGAVAGWRARLTVKNGLPDVAENVAIGALSPVFGGYLGALIGGSFKDENLFVGAIVPVIVLAIIGLVKAVRPMEGDEAPKADRADSVKRAAPIMPIQFVRDLSVLDSEEIVGVEQFPLDNSFGDQPFTSVRHVSRETTNELFIDTASQFGGKLGLDVLSVIKADIELACPLVTYTNGQKSGQFCPGRSPG